MDMLTLFGALAVSAMLLCYALEARAPAFVLAFAAACLASSLYGFLAGAWPFGVIEAIRAGIAARRWRARVRTARRRLRPRSCGCARARMALAARGRIRVPTGADGKEGPTDDGTRARHPA